MFDFSEGKVRNFLIQLEFGDGPLGKWKHLSKWHDELLAFDINNNSIPARGVENYMLNTRDFVFVCKFSFIHPSCFATD